ncbi:hypothetical protein HOLleu_15825 [Holothuria leucospilota]|uniref:Uncharacterized protein n=1 Tax=Holothuria leucospilota TaxID=206669 RepID=A0A9Q1C5E6_HOLLE|nr:hypothetical protein HOLleu_15825 [Holothuria leucospilota]
MLFMNLLQMMHEIGMCLATSNANILHTYVRCKLCVLHAWVDASIRTDTSGNDSKLPVPEEKVTN